MELDKKDKKIAIWFIDRFTKDINKVDDNINYICDLLPKDHMAWLVEFLKKVVE